MTDQLDNLGSDPIFSANSFRPDRDRVAEWKIANIAWRRVVLPKLYRKEEFVPGGGYGRNGWGELYKGETITRLYVRLPQPLIEQYNVLVEYHGCEMPILQGAQPDLVRTKSRHEVDLVYYFSWMGVPR